MQAKIMFICNVVDQIEKGDLKQLNFQAWEPKVLYKKELGSN